MLVLVLLTTLSNPYLFLGLSVAFAETAPVLFFFSFFLLPSEYTVPCSFHVLFYLSSLSPGPDTDVHC